MFDLDEMKEVWTTHDEKLDQCIRLNRQLLKAGTLSKAHSATRRMGWAPALEALMWFAIIVSLGSFISRHVAEIRLSLCAAALDVYAIGMLAATIRQIVALSQIDYSGPVTTIQKQFAMLRVLRIRITQRSLLGGTIVWAPFLIVAARAFLGLDLVNGLWLWLWANVAFGVCLIPLALWLSKTFGERMGRFPFIQRVMNDLAGRNLSAASEFIGKLSGFEAEVI
jgi:hypothetical protein